MGLAAGKLDRKIIIQRLQQTRDEFNNVVEGWQNVARVWASKSDIRDGERFAGSEKAADITTRFQIRYSSQVADVNPKDRILYQQGDRTFVYDIVGVKEIGRRIGLEITASARND